MSSGHIRWQCRRGMLELDIILLSFFDRQFHLLSPPEQEQFIKLLEFPDPILYESLMGGGNLISYAALIAKIRERFNE